MAKIIGLDIGTNSIGWAVIDNETKHIDAAGSRIIPMDAGRLGDFEKGNTVSFTHDRTTSRGMRRLRERFLLRRERLHRVLNILGFLPEHYASQLSRFGKLPDNAEPKLAWREGEDGKPEFLFKDSFNEMLADFHRAGLDIKVPYDWTIYFLRQKALSQPITKAELAWILLQFNQKRGYNQLRGKIDKEIDGNGDKNEEKSYHELKVLSVVDTGEPRKGGGSWFNITLENGWVYKRPCLFKPDWEGKTRGFIATFKLDKNGQRKSETPSISSPSDEDWGLRKIKTEHDIQQAGATLGAYIYQSLLHHPERKIIGDLVQTVDRSLYKEELDKILETQAKYIPELSNRNLYARCIEELYPSNISYRNSIANRNLKYLLSDDILFYQRPLKTKKHLIANCPFEQRNGTPIKCIAKSHPIYQEFRLWQFLANLRLYRNDNDITHALLPDNESYANFYDYLSVQKEIDQTALFHYFKIAKKELTQYRWNYVQDRKYPLGETRAIILGGLDKAGISRDFLTPKQELSLWHIMYSIDDQTQYEKALHTFALRQGWDETQTEAFAKAFKRLTVYKDKDYGAYSAKAISRLLTLMRRGHYWNADYIDPHTRSRIEHLITGETDDSLTPFVREKLKALESLEQYQGLNTWQACYAVYNRHSEAIATQKWTKPEDIDAYLCQFQHNSLNNPVVEQVVTESLRVVRDIWRQTGRIDEIHIELGRELKKNAAERQQMTQSNSENEATNQRIRLLLTELMNPECQVENVRPQSPSQHELLKIYEDGVMQSGIEIPDEIKDIQKRFTAAKNQPTHAEVIKYKLWLDQKYLSPYTAKPIPLAKLFTPAYQIEHIIPQSRWFDDSLSNKVICEAEVNQLKDRELAHEFIVNHAGQKVPLSMGGTVEILSVEAYEKIVKNTFSNRKKSEKLLLDEIPEEFTSRQLVDSRYISRLMMHLLSNIVRTEDEEGNPEDAVTVKNIIPCSGAITDRLKHDWGINDVWNRIILPRFQRLNDITATTNYTATTAQGHTIPQVPLDMRQGFNKKRIDHRHHAMDAIVIACTTRDHINLLNNKSTGSTQRYDLQYKLRAKDFYIDKKGKKQPHFTEFLKPWPSFTEDVYNTLQSIVVSFKQNLRVINKTSNYYSIIQDEKHVTSKQQKGDSWAIRKPLHKETVFGEVNLQLKKKVKIKDAIANPDSIVDRELKAKIKEQKNIHHYTIKQIIEYFDKRKDTWPEAADGKVEVYYYTRDTNDRYFATRYKNEIANYLGNCPNKEIANDKIEKITDTGIQKILKAHLFNEGGNPQIAFNPEGVERMNANIRLLNNGKEHQPIKKVRVYTQGEKFALTKIGLKSHKFYNGDDGKNLHYVIYTVGNESLRNYLVVELQVSVECQKKYGKNWRNNLERFLKEYEKDEKRGKSGLLPENAKILHVLSAGDIVYVPHNQELITKSSLNPRNLYRVRSFDNGHFYCIPINVSSLIYKGKEFGSNDKTQKDYNGNMIRDYCIPIQVDRLGNITKIG